MNKIVCKDCKCEIKESYIVVNSLSNNNQLNQCFDCYSDSYDLYTTNDEDDE